LADELTDPKAAGWKKDPSGRFAGRYWDGSAWTDHVVGADRVRATDPLGTAPVDTDEAPAPVPTAHAPRAEAQRPLRRPPFGPRGWQAWPQWARIGVPVAVVLVLLVVVVLSRGGDDDSGSTTAAPPPKTFAIGETARSEAFDVTVYGFKDPQPPGQFLQPGAGKHYVSVDVQLANRSGEQVNFSSLLQIHLLDAANRQYDSTFGEVAPPAPDGEIPPGQAVRGLTLFEVPQGTTGLKVRVQGSLTAGGVYFKLS